MAKELERNFRDLENTRDMDGFLKALGSSEECSEVPDGQFTIDETRQTQILADALADGADYFCCHLLAAAELAQCGEMKVDARHSRSRLQRLKQLCLGVPQEHRGDYTFFLPGEVFAGLSLSDALDKFSSRESPLHQRLGLGLLQAAHYGDLEIVQGGPDGVSSHRLARGVLEPLNGEESLGEPGLLLRLVCQKPHPSTLYIVLIHLRLACQFTKTRVCWNGKVLCSGPPSLLGDESDQVYFAGPGSGFGSRWGLQPDGQFDDLEIWARIQDQEVGLRLLALWDGVPLELACYSEEEEYTRGLVMVVEGALCRPDGSFRNLARSLALKSALAAKVETVTKALLEKRSRRSSTAPAMVPGEFYRFSSGYTLEDTGAPRSYALKSAFFRNDSRLIESVVLDEKPLVRYHFSRGPEGLAASGHPKEPRMAIHSDDRLRLWEEREGRLIWERELPGKAYQLAFDTLGNWLAVLIKTSLEYELRFFSAEEGRALSALSLEPPEDSLYSIPNGFVIAGQESAAFRITETGDIERQELRLTNRQLSDVSADGRYLLLRERGSRDYYLGEDQRGAYLLDLETLKEQGLSRQYSRFLQDGEYLLSVEGPTISVAPRAAPHEFTERKVPGPFFSISSSGQVLFDKQHCGAFLGNVYDQSWDWVKKTPPVSRAQMTSLLRGIAKGKPDPIIFEGEGVSIAGPEGWARLTDSWRMTAHLNDDYLAWTVGRSTWALSRQSGELKKYDGTLVNGMLVCDEGRGRNIRGLDGISTAKSRLKSSKSEVILDGVGVTRPVLIKTLTGGQVLSALSGEILCRAQSGGSYYETSDWLLFAQLTTGGVKRIWRKSKRGWRWTKLGYLMDFAVSPFENRVYWCDIWGQVQSWDLSAPKPQFPNWSSSHLILSPKARYALAVSDTKCTIYETQSGEALANLQTEPFLDSTVYGHRGYQWLDEEHLIRGQQVIRRGEDNWRRPERLFALPGRPDQQRWSDGRSLLAVSSLGELLLFNYRQGTHLATLHVIGDHWFLFTPEGHWDSDFPDYSTIQPQPRPEDRRVGLMQDLLCHQTK